MTDKEKVDLIWGNTAEILGGVTSTTLGFLVAGLPGALLGAGFGQM